MSRIPGPQDASHRRAPAPSQLNWVLWAVGIAIFPLLMVSCNSGGDGVDLDTRTIDLRSMNDSGYSGQVLLTSSGDDRTVVVVTIGNEGIPAGDFPVAIQEGKCSGLGGNIAYELKPLHTGFLVEQIAASLDVLDDRDYALVVFQSDARSVYVACAEIP